MNTSAPTASTQPPDDGRGELRVTLDTPSHQFNRTASIEVRDESMRLVQRVESGIALRLPPGLYQASAVLEDGVEHRRIADVAAGKLSEVKLVPKLAKKAPPTMAAAPGETGAPPMPEPAGAEPPSLPAQQAAPPPPPPPAASSPASAALPAPSRAPPRSTSMLGGVLRRATDLFRRARPVSTTAASPPAPPVAAPKPAQAPPPPPEERDAIGIDAVEGAEVTRPGDHEWRLHGAPMIATMPTATVRIGDVQWRISLPVNPGGGDCLVCADPGNARTPVSAWIAPERTMVVALQNMLLRGEYAALVPVAEQAIELLRSKYQDPTGAALGALILHKVGGLQPYAAWLENLTNDFAWIPDGKVLLASLLVQDHQQLDRALELALAASRQRMLHAETYSILLDMLRRWPDRAMVEPHRDAIDAIAREGAYVAWGSLFFCHPVRG